MRTKASSAKKRVHSLTTTSTAMRMSCTGGELVLLKDGTRGADLGRCSSGGKLALPRSRKRSSASKASEPEQHPSRPLKRSATVEAPTSPAPAFQIPFDDLCGGIVQAILSYLPTPRDLLHMSVCSKQIRNLITYEHIIRVSIVGGNRYVMRSIASMIHLIHQQNIFVPSPMRLLRISNGKRCELGGRCWGYDRATHYTPKVNVVKPDVGLFICSECDAALFAPFKGDIAVWASDTTNTILPSNSPYSFHSRAITIHQTEHGTSHAIGPYLTMLDYRQVQNTNPCLSYNNDSVQADYAKKREAELKRILDHAKESDPNFNGGYANRSQETFRGLCDSAYELFAARKKEADEERMSRERERNIRKHEKIITMHKYLEECIGDFDWKDIALACEFDDPTGTQYYAGARYSCVFVSKMMRPFIHAPSSKTKKALKDVAEKITALFNSLYEKDFFSYSFLSVEDCWEKAFREYATANLPPRNFLKLSFPLYEPNRGRGGADQKEQPQIFQQFVACGNLRDAFSSVTCTDHGTTIVEIFASVVHDNMLDPANEHMPTSHEFFSEADFRRFSKQFFLRSIDNMGFNAKYARKSLDDLKEILNRIREDYCICHTGILHYLNSRQTRRFLEEDNSAEENIHNAGERVYLSNAEVVRRSILQKPEDIITMMQRNKFSLLRTMHRRYSFNQHLYAQRFLHEEIDL